MHVKQLVMIAVPEGTTRVAMLERGEADMMYLVPGELIERLQKNQNNAGACPLRFLVVGVPWLSQSPKPFP